MSSGRTTRAVSLFWPTGAESVPDVTVEASWADRDGVLHSAAISLNVEVSPHTRAVDLAASAAHLWHASIVTRALELNEAARPTSWPESR